MNRHPWNFGILFFAVFSLALCGTGQAQNPTTDERFAECHTLDVATQSAEDDKALQKIEKQCVKILDDIMANPGSKEEFEEAAWLKYNFLHDLFNWYENNEHLLPKLRKFVLGVDKTKYPEMARWLWLNFLEFQYEYTMGTDEGEERSLKEIKKEVARYGRDIPPDVAKLVMVLLENSEEGSAAYEKYRKLLAESPNEKTREIIHDYEHTRMFVGGRVLYYLEKYRDGDKTPLSKFEGELASDCQKIMDAMKEELIAVNKDRKETDTEELVEQKREEIVKKYHAQILKQLDGSLENLSDEDEFANIASLNFYFLEDIGYFLDEIDQRPFSSLRKMVFGVDKEKHPRIALELREGFLEHRFLDARKSNDEAYYDEYVQEIEHEFFTNASGMSYFGKLVLLTLYDKLAAKDPSSEASYKKYRDMFLNSKNMDDKITFWEFETDRRCLMLKGDEEEGEDEEEEDEEEEVEE